jgi:membrane protease subunit HflC
MKAGISGIVALIVLGALVIVGYSSLFAVRQTEQALVVRLGEPVRVVTEPGLNFKVPFIDTIISIDKRILDLENPAQEIIASDQKRLVVDAFARYRINNALRFYQSVGSIQAANIQLATLLNAALRRVLGEVTFSSLVRDNRAALMIRIRDQLDRETDVYGISVVDVRIAAPICRTRTARRSISGCRPSVSARRRSSAPRARSGRRKSARAPTAREPSSSPRPTSAPSNCAARATANATASSPKPMATMPSSSPSIARCRPMKPG